MEKVIIETTITGCVGRSSLWTLPEEAQRGESSTYCFLAGDEAVLYANWVNGQGHTDNSNTRRPAFFGAVNDQTIGGVYLSPEILKRFSLQVGQ
jgi:hypothetical protein